MRSWLLTIGIAAAIGGCNKPEPRPAVKQVRPAPVAPAIPLLKPTPILDPQAIVRAMGKPGTAKTRVVDVPGSGPTRVTTFQGKTLPKPDSAALAAKCKRGDHSACYKLGRDQERASKLKDAEATWRRSCDAKHAESCFELGRMLANPFVPSGRDAEGVAFMKMACELDAVAACYFLAGWYKKGLHGLPKDPALAKKFHNEGCDNGHYWACKKAGRQPPKP